MILLLGASGYIGQAFVTELRRRRRSFIKLSRESLDYTRFDVLFDYVRKTKPEFLINAAGYTGRPNVDACESTRMEAVQGNVIFPQNLARVCFLTNTPWGHVSSGCIYSGAKVCEDQTLRVERDLTQLSLTNLFASHPERFHGFNESDEPNFSFRTPPCSFYCGTKALAEEALRNFSNCYLWRLRIPFDEFDHPRNFLSKIQHYPKVYNDINSISHRGDFVRACLDLWERHAPFGAYNVTNPGSITTRQVVQAIQHVLKPNRRFEFWKDDVEFYGHAAKTPRSNCILDVSKLLATGVKIRPVQQALEESLEHWQPTVNTLRMLAGMDERISEFSPMPSANTSRATAPQICAALG